MKFPFGMAYFQGQTVSLGRVYQKPFRAIIFFFRKVPDHHLGWIGEVASELKQSSSQVGRKHPGGICAYSSKDHPPNIYNIHQYSKISILVLFDFSEVPMCKFHISM